MVILNIIVAINIAILAAMLYWRKNNALPNKILALILIIPGLNFINNISILTGSIFSFPYTYFLVQGTALLFAPLVLYYILLLTGKKGYYQKVLYLISGLLFIFNIYLGIDFSLLDKTDQNTYMNAVLNGPYPTAVEIYSLLFFLLQLAYFTFGAKEVFQYRKKAKHVVSDLEMTKYYFLKRFIVLLWTLTFVTIVLYATINTIYVEYIFLPLVISAIYVFILYFAFHYHAIFTAENFENQNTKGVNAEIQNISVFNKEKFFYPEELKDKIEFHLNEDKAYKDPEVSLQKMASKLDYPAYQISIAINKGFNTNFYDLINKKRIDASMKLLTDMQLKKLSIEGVAYEVGFNSRTAFYRAFKKYTGKKPSDFVNN
jgi:AraC-like DNA-binding protein